MATQAAPHRFPDGRVEFSGHGAPTNGVTGKRFALRGSRYIDLDIGSHYRNTGSAASPVWAQIDAAASLTQVRHVRYTNPLGADVDVLVADTLIDDGDILGAVQPDYPRGLSVTVTDADATAAGILTVAGLDANGQAATEDFDLAGGSQTLLGQVAFAQLASAIIAGAAGGLGDEDQVLTPSGGPGVNEEQHVALTDFSGPITEVQQILIANGDGPTNAKQTATVTDGDGPTNEVYSLHIGTATGGTLTFTFGAQTTGDIPVDATDDDVHAFLAALNNLAWADLGVSGAGTVADPWIITFIGSKAGAAQTLTADGTNLTGPDGPGYALDNSSGGNEGYMNNTVDGKGADTLTFTVPLTPVGAADTTGELAWNILAADLITELEALTSVGVGNVDVTEVGGVYTIEFIGALAGMAIDPITKTETGCTVVINAVAQVGKGPDTYTLTWPYGVPDTTGSLNWNADAATIQTEVDGLSNVPNPGDILVEDLGGGIIRFSFIGATLAGIDVDEFTATPTGCDVTPSTTTPGYGGDRFKLTEEGGAESADKVVHPDGWYGAGESTYSEANVKALIESIAGFVGTVEITNLDNSGFDIEFTGAGAETNKARILVSSGEGVTGVTTTPTAGKPPGTFTIEHDSNTTGAVAQDDDAAAMQVLLDAAGLADVIASGPAGGPWGLHFEGAYGSSDQPLVTIVDTDMTVIPTEVLAGQGDLVSIGVGTILGLPTSPIASGLEVYKTNEGDADATTGTVDQDFNTVDPDTPPDGTADYDFFYTFSEAAVN